MANHNQLRRPFAEVHQEDRTSPKCLFDTPSHSSLSSVPPPPQYPLSALKNDSDYFNDASSLTMTPPRDQNRKQITHQSQPETQPSSSTGKSQVSSSGGTAMVQNYDTWQTQPLHHSRSNSLTSTSKFVGLIQSELDLTPWAHDTSSLLRAVSQFLSQEQQIPSRIPGGLLLLHAPMTTITMLQYRALIQLLQQGDYQWSEPVPGGIIQVLVKGGDEDDQDSRFASSSSAPQNPLSNPPDPADQAALLRYYQDLTAKLLQERADMELAAKLRLQEEEEDPQYYLHSQSRHSLKSNSSNRTTSDLTSRRNAVKVLVEQQHQHHQHQHQHQHSNSRRSSASSLSSNAEIRAELLLRQQLEDDERFARLLSSQDPNHQPGAYAVVEPDRNSSSTAPRTMTQVPQRGRPQLTASGGANPIVGIDSVAAPSRRRRLAPRPMDSSPPPALLESSSTSSFLPDEDDVALQLALKLSSHHSSNIGQILQNEESFHDQSVLSRDTSTITQVPSVNTNKQNDGHEMDDNDDIALQIALELSREHSPEEVPHLRERLTALGLPPELLSKNPIR